MTDKRGCSELAGLLKALELTREQLCIMLSLRDIGMLDTESLAVETAKLMKLSDKELIKKVRNSD